jgi:hypothetical protein
MTSRCGVKIGGLSFLERTSLRVLGLTRVSYEATRWYARAFVSPIILQALSPALARPTQKPCQFSRSWAHFVSDCPLFPFKNSCKLRFYKFTASKKRIYGNKRKLLALFPFLPKQDLHVQSCERHRYIHDAYWGLDYLGERSRSFAAIFSA